MDNNPNPTSGSPSYQTQPSLNNTYRIIIITLIILIIISSSAALFFYIQLSQSQNSDAYLNCLNKQKSWNPQTRTCESTPSTNKDIHDVDTPTQTTDWQTYTNTKHNFSIKVPSNETLPNPNLSYGYITTLIEFTISDIDPQDCRGACPTIQTSEITTINNTPVIQRQGIIGSIGGNIPHNYISYTFTQNNTYYTFTLHGINSTQTDITETNQIVTIDPKDETLFTQIMSTLQFTNTLISETSDQQNYTHPTEGYSITISKDWNIEQCPEYFASYIKIDTRENPKACNHHGDQLISIEHTTEQVKNDLTDESQFCQTTTTQLPYYQAIQSIEICDTPEFNSTFNRVLIPHTNPANTTQTYLLITHKLSSNQLNQFLQSLKFTN